MCVCVCNIYIYIYIYTHTHTHTHTHWGVIVPIVGNGHTIQVQILDKDVYISHSANTITKDMI